MVLIKINERLNKMLASEMICMRFLSSAIKDLKWRISLHMHKPETQTLKILFVCL